MKVGINNKIKNFFNNPINIVTLIALAFLAYTVLVPLFKMINSTFLWKSEDIRFAAEAIPGEFTLYHWLRVLYSDISDSLFYGPLLNSLAIGVSVAIISMILGCGLAWLVVSTDIPFKRAIGFLTIIPYLFPSWVASMAWLGIFKNDKIGGSLGILQGLFHVNPPDWIAYGFVPIVASLSIHDSIYFYLIVGAALSSMNSQLSEAAKISGANTFKILKKIVFPIVLPSILSAFILIFSKAISSFAVPELLGAPVKFYTVSTMLYSSMRSRMVTEANVLSLILIVISMGTIAINQKLIGKRKSYVTVTGKGAAQKLISLGKARNIVGAAMLTMLVLISILPLLLILFQTFLLKDGNFNFNNLTLHYWIGESIYEINTGEPGIFHNETFLLGLKNSLYIAIMSSIIAALVGLILGYVISRGKGARLSKFIDQISFVPYLIPGISLSAIYISMFAKPTLFLPALYGSISLIILITIIKELPFTTRVGSSSMLQLGEELEEAAKINGANFYERFKRIILPLNKKSLFTSFLLVFIGAMKEMELIIMLVTPKTETLTTLTFYYTEKGFTQLTNAILIFTILIIIFVYFSATVFGKIDLSKGLGR
ncbi:MULTISPECIES: iron ABC transporter permease [unclassified Clostridium]|uniref:ABC transporter permease n=1 Tax=unclassified Clostridium TaxID=2614128 RepID=UPI000297CCDC|nr:MULTISPECIES: iron ABC transporter permease [unclassified Clostridium]EKQ58053.1 MAG: ABC-type Fe3+ transport system, permease component [Clostridium sp. Maddingley MBC34-26]